MSFEIFFKKKIQKKIRSAESLLVSDPKEGWVFHVLPDPTGAHSEKLTLYTVNALGH